VVINEQSVFFFITANETIKSFFKCDFSYCWLLLLKQIVCSNTTLNATVTCIQLNMPYLTINQFFPIVYKS